MFHTETSFLQIYSDYVKLIEIYFEVHYGKSM